MVVTCGGRIRVPVPRHGGRRCEVRGLVAGFLPMPSGSGGSMAQAASQSVSAVNLRHGG
jgi:hypothetical protein